MKRSRDPGESSKEREAVVGRKVEWQWCRRESDRAEGERGRTATAAKSTERRYFNSAAIRSRIVEEKKRGGEAAWKCGGGGEKVVKKEGKGREEEDEEGSKRGVGVPVPVQYGYGYGWAHTFGTRTPRLLLGTLRRGPTALRPRHAEDTDRERNLTE